MIYKISENYNLQILSINDLNSIKKLCESCSDYYIMSGGVLPTEEEINEIFTDLPPNKKQQDKHLFGVFKSNILVGIVDVVRDFPINDEWIIGLLLLKPNERGKGLGEKIHEVLIQWAKPLGAKSFRVGVIIENINAIRFWDRLGYIEIEKKSMNIKQKNHVVIVKRLVL